MKTNHRKIDPALSREAIVRAESKTPFGGVIETVVSIPSLMSSNRQGGKPVAFNPSRVNVSISFSIPSAKYGSISIVTARRIQVAKGSAPTFRKDTIAALRGTGASLELIHEIEKSLVGMIERARDAADLANLSVGAVESDFFDA